METTHPISIALFVELILILSVCLICTFNLLGLIESQQYY